ncbi:hypothetical protein ACQJBY_072158 [Aegilops geniculata]
MDGCAVTISSARFQQKELGELLSLTTVAFLTQGLACSLAGTGMRFTSSYLQLIMVDGLMLPSRTTPRRIWRLPQCAPFSSPASERHHHLPGRLCSSARSVVRFSRAC